jgi:lipid-A-disaccharide synthase
MAQEVLSWLAARQSQPERIRNLEHRFTALHTELARDTPQLAADAIAQILQN